MGKRMFLGIDSGLSGACALLGEPDSLEIGRIPTRRVGVKGTKREYDVAALHDMLHRWRTDQGTPLLAITETIQPFPQANKIACCKMGFGSGIIIGLLTALEIPFELVHPQTWQRAILQGKKRGKEANILQARRLFPRSRGIIGTDGEADAVLLAEYARRTWLGTR